MPMDKQLSRSYPIFVEEWTGQFHKLGHGFVAEFPKTHVVQDVYKCLVLLTEDLAEHDGRPYTRVPLGRIESEDRGNLNPVDSVWDGWKLTEVATEYQLSQHLVPWKV